MKQIFLAAILIVALLASVGTVSANLISNGGFEYPVNTISWQIYADGTPGLVWNVQDGIGVYDSSVPTAVEFQTLSTIGLTPYEGKQYAELDSYGNVNISQVITTEKGAMYRVSFAQSCRSGDVGLPSNLGVYLNDAKLLATSCSAQSWTVHTVDFAGTDGDVTMKFVDEGISSTYGVLLDDITVEKTSEPTAVPEFPTAFLPVTFIVGFLGAVLMIQMTRK